MSTGPALKSAQDDLDFDLEDDLDLDIDLDALDEAELQRLLDEDEEIGEPVPEAPPAAPGSAGAPAAADAAAPPPAAAPAVPADAPPVAHEAAAADDTLAPPAALADDADDAAVDIDVSGLTLLQVPRINISIFCQTPTLTALAEQAASDRRLDKAHVTLQTGDAFRAAQVFTYEQTPNLIILEASESQGDLLEGLAKLAEVCDPSTQVVIIGAINDIKLYRALMERGISDYLVAPRSPLEIVSAVSSLYADPQAAPVGKTYAFVGARGGTGSSVICHNVAWAMAERCLSDTVVMDLDLPFGTGSLDFEQDPSQGLAEALGAPERLDDVLLERLLQKCTDRLSLFAAPNLLDRDYEMSTESFEQVIEMVRGTAPSVVLDLPQGWTSWTQKQLQTADAVVITATPDLASFRNAKNMVETLIGARGPDGTPLLVLNQTGVKGRPEVAAEQFAEALEIEPFAVLPFEPTEFGVAETNAQSLCEAAPKSKATEEVQRLAATLLGRDEVSAAPSASVVKSVLGLFK